MRVATASALLLAIMPIASAYAGPSQTRQRVSQAARQPLRDLNLDGDRIASPLASAVHSPYSLEGIESCNDIAVNIVALDAELGLDLDAGLPGRDRWIDRTIDMGGGMISGLMPYRGVLREVSGANAADRRRALAARAGAARRGFLKGVGWASGCAPPAAPRLSLDWAAINAVD